MVQIVRRQIVSQCDESSGIPTPLSHCSARSLECTSYRRFVLSWFTDEGTSTGTAQKTTKLRQEGLAQAQNLGIEHSHTILNRDTSNEEPHFASCKGLRWLVPFQVGCQPTHLLLHARGLDKYNFSKTIIIIAVICNTWFINCYTWSTFAHLHSSYIAPPRWRFIQNLLPSLFNHPCRVCM